MDGRSDRVCVWTVLDRAIRRKLGQRMGQPESFPYGSRVKRFKDQIFQWW